MNLTGQERFVLKGPLRNNGVGQLLAGEDLTTGHRIAMRKMPLEAMGAMAVEAIEALPEHESLPAVVASGREETQVWLALDFPAGALLSIEPMPLDKELWLKVAIQVASALAAAHAAGTVHGELSTDSVLLADGRVLLFDLPLVLANRLTDRRGEARALAQLALTVTYLPMERAKGQEPTEAGDVYSLAVMLCLAGGAEAVPGSTALEKMHRIVSEGWKPELPLRVPEMHALLTRMLSSDPAQRPTMAEAAAALKVIPQLEELSPQQPTIPAPQGEGARSAGEGEHLQPAVTEADPFESLIAAGVSVSAPDPHALPTRQMDSLGLQQQQVEKEIAEAKPTPPPEPARTAPDAPKPSLKAWLAPAQVETGAAFRWSSPPVATGLTSPEMKAVELVHTSTAPSMEAIAAAAAEMSGPFTGEIAIPPPVATTPPMRAREPAPMPTPPARPNEPLKLAAPTMIAEPPAPAPALAAPAPGSFPEPGGADAPPPVIAKTVTDLPAASPASLLDTARNPQLPPPLPGAKELLPEQVQLPIPPPLPTAPPKRRTPPSSKVLSAERAESPLPPGILSWMSATNGRLIGSVAGSLLMVLLGLSLLSELVSRRSAIAELTRPASPAAEAKAKADRLKQPVTKSSRAAAMRDTMKQEKTDDEY